MSRDGKFGTFGGVYTPSLLTILGVIMYLRLPWVIGSAGLYQALGIILVAHVISVSTGLSISSIATDKAVGAGGPYYIISRSLGLPIGGALGLALFVGLAFSISLYIIGFAESFLTYFKLGATIDNIRLCGTIALVSLTIVTFISTALAIKAQYVILGLIALSLISIVAGALGQENEAPLLFAPAEAVALPTVFAIFFPAVTGFTAGVNMSGDLRSPKRSIPSGTMAAVATGFVVYVCLSVLLAMRIPGEQLREDPELLINIAVSGPLVVAGIWAATLSSALGSILGSPRILQAVSADAIMPKLFARGYGPTQEPRNALVLAFLLGEAGVLIGELDAIARIVSMIFLSMYCVLNLSCALESWASPDFRPDFRIPKSISIIGSVTCIVVMIQLDLAAMTGAMLLMAGLFVYLQRKQLQLESGDTWEGIWSSLVRAGLHRLTRAARQKRHWKPNVIAFDAGASDSPAHSELAEALVGSAGMLTHVHVHDRPGDRTQPAATTGNRKLPRGEPQQIGVFHRQLAAGVDRDAAIVAFCSHHGFAGIEPNTVLLQFADFAQQPAHLAGLLADLAKLDFNQLVVSRGRGRGESRERKPRIDLWWRDQGGNLPLSLSLARFMTTSPRFEQATIRLVLLSDTPGNNDVLRARARRYLKSIRLDAEVKVINNTLNLKGYEDWLRDESGDSDLIVCPLPDLPSEADTPFLSRAARVLPELPDVLFIRASSAFEEVLSPGVSATDSLLPGPQDSDDTFSLPAPPLEGPDALKEYVGELRTSYQTLLAGFDVHCVARVHSQNIELIRRLRAALERQFQTLDKGLAGANARRKRQLLNRFLSSFVMDGQALIDHHLREGLGDQQATLEGRIEAFLEEEAQLGGAGRPPLLIERDLADLRPTSDDSPLVRRIKRRRRLGARLLRRPARCRVQVAPLQRHYFDRAKRELLLPSIAQLVAESNQLAVHLGKVLCSSREGIAVTVSEALAPGDEQAAISELKQRALAPFDRLVERAKSRVRAHRRDLRERAYAMLQQMADDLSRFDVERLVQRERKTPRDAAALREQLFELPRRFSDVQARLYERASVGLTVSAFHHRLSAIVQRQEDTLALQLRTGPLRVCEDVARSLRELLATLQEGRGAGLRAPKLGTVEDRLSPKDAIAAFSAEAEPALLDLPETVSLLSDAAVDALEEGRDATPEVVELSLRSLGQFLVESELVAGVYQEVDPVPELEGRALSVTRDVTRLLAFQLAELKELGLTEPADQLEHLRPALNSGIDRIETELAALRALDERLGERFATQLVKVIEGSEPYRLTDAGSRLGQHRRLRQGKIAVSGAQGLLRKAQARARAAVVDLLYRGSAGVVLARSLQARERESASLVERLRALVRDNSPQQATLNAMPFYYRQVFFGQALNESFWVGRERELAQARAAAQSHRDGQAGIILVVGQPGSGKTALCQRMAVKALDQRSTYFVQAPAAGSTDPEAFHEALARAVGVTGSYEDIFDRLPEHSALILDDLELWWERSEDGLAVVDLLMSLIARHGQRVLFVLSLGSHTFKLLHALRPIADHALAVIDCGPMAARELGSVLTLRHGSTGMKFELSGTQEESLSSFQLARLFSRHFGYCQGSVGAAMRGWITHVEKVRDGVMTIRAPRRPQIDALAELRGPWRALLIELSLHRRLTLQRLQRIAGLPERRIADDVDALVRAGLLTRSRQGLLELNPFVRQILTSHMEQQGMLPA